MAPPCRTGARNLGGGPGESPMRYFGGLLGGTWLTRLFCDLGNGKFDGAHLVSNFEGLNPANTFWDKYYHLYANVDTEPPRFLRVRAVVGGLLPAQRGGDLLDRQRAVRRQPAGPRRDPGGARDTTLTSRTSARPSSSSRRLATTSPRPSRHSTGSPTFTPAPRRSRPTDR